MTIRFARRLACCCGLALLASNPALAGNPQSAAADASKKDPDRIVCRSEAMTGSRMHTRVCRTQAQWDDLTDKARDQLDDRLERGSRLDPTNRPG